MTPARIRALASLIVRRFRPEQVVLFGSHAYGTPTRDSDVDLLVVTRRRLDAATVRCSLPDSIPTDILTFTRSEIARRLAFRDPFVCEILEKGNVLYDARRSRVG